MKELVKIHLHHFFGFRFLLIVFISIIIQNAIYFIMAREAYDNLIYFQTSFPITKIIATLLATFCFGFYFNIDHDSYAYLILPSLISRKKYLFSKMLVFYSFFLCYIVVSLLSFLIAGYFMQPRFYWMDSYILFFHLFHVTLIYGLYTTLFFHFIKNPFVMIFVFFLFIIGNNFTIQSKNKIVSVFLFLFPNGELYFESFFLLFLYDIWLIILLIGVILFIYKKIDIQI